MKYPNETPFETVKEKALELENSITDMDEVEYVFNQVGSSADFAQFGEIGSPTEAVISILLKDKADTDKVLKEIEKKKG